MTTAKEPKQSEQAGNAVGIPLDRRVRPCAWTAHSWLANRHGGHFVPKRRQAFDVPLYDQAALDAAVAAADTGAELERLRQALRDIADPIAAWQRDLQEGYTLDGAACVRMADDPETYRRMAREALKA